MNKKARKLLAAILTAAVLGCASVPTLAADIPSRNIPVTVHVDGNYVSTDVKPYISNGRTYLPLRAAAEAMGASVSWDPYSSTATVSNGTTVIRCTVGSTVYTVNGVPQYANAAPQIVSGRTMLPIRPIAEALGGTLSWNPQTADAAIDTAAPNATTPSIPSYIPAEARMLIEKYYVQPNGAGLGSWLSRDLNENRSIFNNTALFVSEMADGSRHGIQVFWRETPYGTIDGIGVDDYEITAYDSGFHLKDDWTPFYWNGAGIGSGYPVYSLYNLNYASDNLNQTGYWTYYNLQFFDVPPADHGSWTQFERTFTRF